jgi:hypothetical protein
MNYQPKANVADRDGPMLWLPTLIKDRTERQRTTGFRSDLRYARYAQGSDSPTPGSPAAADMQPHQGQEREFPGQNLMTDDR